MGSGMERDELDDPRRRLLIHGLAMGVFSGLAPNCAIADAIFSARPSKLPPNQSIYRINGTAKVNGKEATIDTPVGPNDTVETGKNSEIVFVVGTHAMLVRGNSKLGLQGAKKESSSVVSGLRMLSGKLLSVSSNQAMKSKTQTATIGIRGTGLYVESDPELTYFCTCYGITDVFSTNDPESKDTVVAKQHDKPLFITADGAKGQNIQRAGFKNHTDEELMLIETLVGRTPPFVFPGGQYKAPRRGY